MWSRDHPLQMSSTPLLRTRATRRAREERERTLSAKMQCNLWSRGRGSTIPRAGMMTVQNTRPGFAIFWSIRLRFLKQFFFPKTTQERSIRFRFCLVSRCHVWKEERMEDVEINHDAATIIFPLFSRQLRSQQKKNLWITNEYCSHQQTLQWIVLQCIASVKKASAEHSLV